MLERLTSRYKDRNITWDYETDNIFSLSKSDIMFSDFSGIILDYVFLYDKPVIYSTYSFDLRPYDADDLAHEPWQFRTLKEIGIELRESDFASIGDVIQKASNSASLTEARRIARDTAWQCRGEAGVLIANFVMETIEKTNG
jgi:CDP-glycerol glycerophosphotransferase (TagB/SpsB family)